jgi:hypothetical protein
LSRGTVQTLLTASPLHAWTQHPRLNPKWRPTHHEKFDLGSAAHEVLLGGESTVRVVLFDDWRTSAAKEERELAREEGRIPILAKDWERVEEMVDAVRGDIVERADSPPLFADGDKEVTAIWRDHGVLCRCRFDWLRTDGTATDDLKTTSRSANPAMFGRTLFGMGYDIQAAFYLRAMEAMGAGSKVAFRFVVVETTPPYALSVVQLSKAALELANAKIDCAIKLWKSCLETDTWPGYPASVVEVDPPTWAEADWLAREEIAA